MNYYATMGLLPEATSDEIRKAYRRLALQWHPDRNPGDPRAPERFREISEAYAVLIDPSKRREYDRARQAGAPDEFRHSREDLFRDLFANPTASGIFEELAREFERMGLRVDRHYFHQTLFGGRAVVTGGVFIITPLTPVLALFKLARAALGATRVVSPVAVPRSRPSSLVRAADTAGGVLRALGQGARWLLGLSPVAMAPAPTLSGDVMVVIRLTRGEAELGTRKRVMLNADGGPEELLVSVPPGTRAGSKLRLRRKGRLGTSGARGDVYLTVEITD
jgi:hypothetical protein